MDDVENIIREDEPIQNNFAFITRIPEHIFSQIREGYSIKIIPRVKNEPLRFDLLNENGDKVGDFQSNPEEIKDSQFDSILQKDGDSFARVLPIPPDFSFKTHQSHVIEIKEHTKKHENMSQGIQIIKNLHNEGSDVFRDWSAKKAYDSILVMKQRFQKSKKNIFSLLDEFQTAINSNPQILTDPSILQSISTDINAYLNDMKSVTQCVDNFSKANQHQIKV
ncbi:hypothetical protein M9Y10_039551 [Tritrichomonas musculus]|uniref:Uncharacterized protein n=1 Tax=Tritrichomonas musculus TaxID=1915356 RepID=A0ABR2KBJ2_9EUKA